MSSRFSLSFPGRRGKDDPWFRIGAVDVNTSLLVAILCGISLFVWAASPSLIEPLIMWPDDVLSGQVWRLVTWPLANEPSIWTVLTIAMLWYFGRELERMVGRTQFLVLLVLLAVVPGIVGTLLDIPLAEIRAVEIAVLCLFIAEYPNVRFFFGIQAWVLGVVIIGIEVLQLLGLRQGDRIVLLFVGLATAALAGRRYGLLTAYPWIPKLGGGGSGGTRRSGGGSRRQKQRGRVSSRDADRVVSGPWQGPSPADQDEMDRLLDKMNSVGLTDSERKRLSELGKRLGGR